MKRLKHLLFGAAALMIGSAGAAHANLIVNGGFETGNLSGWSITGNTGDIGVTTAGFDGFSPHSGNYFAYLGAVGSLGFLNQTVTTADQQYTLSLWFASDGDTPNEFDVAWDSTTLYDVVNNPAHGYQQLTFTVTGTGSDTLSISERNDPGYFALDDVSLDPVPEPASLALFGTALAGLGLVCRRKRAA